MPKLKAPPQHRQRLRWSARGLCGCRLGSSTPSGPDPGSLFGAVASTAGMAASSSAPTSLFGASAASGGSGGGLFGASGGGFGAPAAFGAAPTAPGQPSMFAQAFQQSRPQPGARRRRR